MMENVFEKIKKIARRDVKKVDVGLIAATNPKSSYAEAVKSIRTNLLFSAVEKDLKTILVTSPQSGDGKSATAANLAVAFAQDKKKVLVIDGDMRKGRQHKIFGVTNEPALGYSNYILKFKEGVDSGMAAFIKPEYYVKETKIPGVYLLPSGATPPNPLELISSKNNKRLIDSFKDEYDVIIIDCPPALGLSDALVMSKYTDANIVVVSNAKTKIDQLENVKKSFEKVGSKIAGVVINKAKTKDYYYANEYYTKLEND